MARNYDVLKFEVSDDEEEGSLFLRAAFFIRRESLLGQISVRLRA